MKKYFHIIILGVYCLTSNDYAKTSNYLTTLELEKIFVSAIKEFWDYNYNTEGRLHFGSPIYSNERNAYVFIVDDKNLYSATIDSSTGQIYSLANFKSSGALYAKKNKKVSSDEIIKINKIIINKLHLGHYNFKLSQININSPSENKITIIWKRTYKGYQYEHDMAYFTFTETGVFLNFAIFVPSIEPKMMEILIDSKNANKLALIPGEQIANKYDIHFPIIEAANAQLFIVNPNYIHNTTEYFSKKNYSNPRLAWVVEIKSTHPRRGSITLMHVWIDAQNGESLGGKFYNW